MQKKAKLYLVPVPLGNLEDITFRAVRILQSVDYIAAEDTRTSSILLKHYQISTPCTSLHQFNEHQKIQSILVDISEKNKQVAVVTDAGTPGISDPGFLIVREALEKNIEIECLPGPTAFVPALVASGLPCDKFVFEGFLPVKKGRKTRLEFLVNEYRTIVLYESPFRIVKTLKELHEYLGERKAVVAREISKKFETYHRGSLLELATYFQQKEAKGEIVLIVQGSINKNDILHEDLK